MLMRFLATCNTTRSCDPPASFTYPPDSLTAKRRYEESHKTDLLAIRGGETGMLLLCLDCAIREFFGGVVEALEDIDYGKATRGQDREGYPYRVVHYANVERDPAFRRDSRLICTQDRCRREIYTHEHY